MAKKNERIDTIRKIISEELIGSQEELINRLGEFGIKATQSTLSRDFKTLNIAKTPHPQKGYVYVLGATVAPDIILASPDLNESILWIRFSGNIGVISTKSGYASAVAVLVDGIKMREVIGSIAGDNTIMLVLREGADRDAIVETLRRHFPALEYGI